jgi:hypothetical protein
MFSLDDRPKQSGDQRMKSIISALLALTTLAIVAGQANAAPGNPSNPKGFYDQQDRENGGSSGQ